MRWAWAANSMPNLTWPQPRQGMGGGHYACSIPPFKLATCRPAPPLPLPPSAGAELRMKGLNRIGNMLVPNSNYCKFEDWIIPILDACLKVGRRDGD